jgi:hypothetical protein
VRCIVYICRSLKRRRAPAGAAARAARARAPRRPAQAPGLASPQPSRLGLAAKLCRSFLGAVLGHLAHALLPPRADARPRSDRRPTATRDGMHRRVGGRACALRSRCGEAPTTRRAGAFGRWKKRVAVSDGAHREAASVASVASAPRRPHGGRATRRSHRGASEVTSQSAQVSDGHGGQARPRPNGRLLQRRPSRRNAIRLVEKETKSCAER